MRKDVLTFVSLALLALTVVPAINIILDTAKTKPENRWWDKSVLYSIDFAQPLLNHLLFTIGISANPSQVVIGKNGWLYLGDKHERTITVTRGGSTVEDAKIIAKIGLATKSWEQWLKERGVRMYLLMPCPNKDTIYPEFAPDWMQAATNSPTNVLLTSVNQDLYVDPRGILWSAKSQFSGPLYYKTDTHWNNLGAWVAFRSLTMKASRTETGLRWLSEQDIHVSKVSERHGGDLANILKISEKLRDIEVTIKIASERPIETKQYDFETGRLITSGGNPPVVAPKHPVLVKSQHALNQKKILWLRDSYGTAMAPYMAATFTETLQADYRKTDPDLFARLVDAFKPDYVFTTVAERDARVEWFSRLPPSR